MIHPKATILRLATLLLMLASIVQGQARMDNLESPVVHPDRRVTFRIRAPKASEVTLTGDWMDNNAREKLTKDDAGVWSVTLGPLAPGGAIYNFVVDGMAIADPVNPRIKLRARTSASVVEVPGDGTELWQAKDVPHGKVDINFAPSKVLGENRQVWVYTPPGYDQTSGTRYPVLYLFHGSNDTAAGWTQVGHANYILDNLLAQKKAVSMIVVMPFGHAAPFGARGAGGADNDSLFERYMLEDVILGIEKSYRIANGRENRAVVGLSMGGGQALKIGLGHLDLFSSVGSFSGAVPGDAQTRFKAILDDPASTNSKLKLLWFGCGKQDSLFDRSQKFNDLLDEKKIHHTFRATDGRHNYAIWRQYLGEIVPLLFQPNEH